MKNMFRNSLVIFVLMIGVFALTGCGKKDLSAYAGTYEGDYTKLVGDTKQTTDEEFSLVLNADGTGKHNRDGESYDVEWSIDGEKFKMSDKFGPLTVDYTGTLKDGKLDIFNGDPEDIWTYEYVYTKK